MDKRDISKSLLKSNNILDAIMDLTDKLDDQQLSKLISHISKRVLIAQRMKKENMIHVE